MVPQKIITILCVLSDMVIAITVAPITAVTEYGEPTEVTSAICKLHEGRTALCPVKLNSSYRELDIAITVNSCSNPTDVHIAVQDDQAHVVWEHVFVNTDESQVVGGLDGLYVILQVQLVTIPKNNTLYIQASIQEDATGEQAVFLRDTILRETSDECKHSASVNTGLIVLLAFASLCILLLILTIIFTVMRRCQSKAAAAGASGCQLYPSLEDAQDGVSSPLSECTDGSDPGCIRSSMLINNAIFKGRHHKGFQEDSRLPMIQEERDDNWAAYENVAVLQDEVLPASKKPRKKRKSRWTAKAGFVHKGHTRLKSAKPLIKQARDTTTDVEGSEGFNQKSDRDSHKIDIVGPSTTLMPNTRI